MNPPMYAEVAERLRPIGNAKLADADTPAVATGSSARRSTPTTRPQGWRQRERASTAGTRPSPFRTTVDAEEEQRDAEREQRRAGRVELHISRGGRSRATPRAASAIAATSTHLGDEDPPPTHVLDDDAADRDADEPDRRPPTKGPPAIAFTGHRVETRKINAIDAAPVAAPSERMERGGNAMSEPALHAAADKPAPITAPICQQVHAPVPHTSPARPSAGAATP